MFQPLEVGGAVVLYPPSCTLAIINMHILISKKGLHKDFMFKFWKKWNQTTLTYHICMYIFQKKKKKPLVFKQSKHN